MAKDKYKDKYPAYLPLHYWLYLRWRKLIRQTQIRRWRKAALEKGPQGIEDDGAPQFAKEDTPNPLDHINKTAHWMDDDLARPEIKKIVDAIEETKQYLTENDLRYTATAASFIPRLYTDQTEKKNSWENAWVFHHAGIEPGMSILDIGGASTAFNFYLASIACQVRIIDNDWNNVGIVYNTNYVGKKMDWDICAYDMDAGQGLPFDDSSFDRVLSICVVEHLTSASRRNLMEELARVLKPGGIIGLTTDYDNKRDALIEDKGLRFGFPEKLTKDIIEPSGLTLMGNTELLDPCPNENFLGAFFLKK